MGEVPPCAGVPAGLQCAGPMTFSARYLETLKDDYDYDIAGELPWLGMCLQSCGNRCTVNPSPCTEPHKGACKMVNRQPTCGCEDGYELSNGNCVLKADACQSSIAPACDNGGTCTVNGAELACSCPPGGRERTAPS